MVQNVSNTYLMRWTTYRLEISAISTCTRFCQLYHDITGLEERIRNNANLYWLLSPRYVMTSNVPLEKNKMASTLAVSAITTWSVHKMQGGRKVRVKVKGNRMRCGEETENV